jgi:hypothetical protein
MNAAAGRLAGSDGVLYRLDEVLTLGAIDKGSAQDHVRGDRLTHGPPARRLAIAIDPGRIDLRRPRNSVRPVIRRSAADINRDVED